MTTSSAPFTVTSLLAAAAEILEGAGFKAVDLSASNAWRATASRVYEDAYSIVCVAVYETWADLSSRWIDDQSRLVGLISEFFAQTEAKAWDGYLVLLTPSVVPTTDRLSAIGIQRNTLYLRKLLADGGELRTVNDVRRVLLPLLPLVLPLEKQEQEEGRGVLDALPSLLSSHGVDKEAARVAIEAFREQRPIIPEIHELVTKRREHQS